MTEDLDAINEQVARKLGDSYLVSVGVPISSSSMKIEKWPITRLNREQLRRMHDFSGDIAAAWEIVGHLPYFHLSTVGYLNMKDGSGITRWICRSVDASDLNKPIGYEAEADTAPLAICKAFLKLPGESNG